MAKGFKQPKIKISQPIALEPRLRDILERHGVRKPPTVDKVEALEKAATAKKWLFLIKQDRKDGLTHVKLEVPGPDELIYFEATAMTTALAMTHALCDALENGPQQANMFDGERAPTSPPDPSGADTPLFRGNGGVASVAEIELEANKAAAVDPDPDEVEFDDEITDLEDQLDQAIQAGDAQDAEPSAVEGWQFLFVVDPEDVKLWKRTPPLVDDDGDVPNLLVAWEEGDDGTGADRGFYVKPGYQYLKDIGEIRRRDPNGGLPRDVVWSRSISRHPTSITEIKE